jgi:hypothetical protein
MNIFSFARRTRADSLLRKALVNALIALALISAVTGAQAAGRVFFDDFEAGNTNKWSADDFRNKCRVATGAVDGVPARAGSSMAECNWNGLTAWNDPSAYTSLKLGSWDYSNEFLIRLWVRYANDVDRAFGSKLLRLDPNDFKDSFYLNAQMEQSNGPVFICWEWINGSTGPSVYGDGNLGDGSWHELEIYIKLNTTGARNGVVRIWQDGRVKHEAVNITSVYPGNRWFPLYLMSNWSNNPGSEHDASNHVYWDNVEIYSDRGSGATGSLADASITVGAEPAPPAPLTPKSPTNVRVQ